MTMQAPFATDPDDYVTCAYTGDMIHKDVAVYDNWRVPYASQQALDAANDEADADDDLRRICGGWR